MLCGVCIAVHRMPLRAVIRSLDLFTALYRVAECMVVLLWCVLSRYRFVLPIVLWAHLRRFAILPFYRARCAVGLLDACYQFVFLSVSGLVKCVTILSYCAVGMLVACYHSILLSA